MKKFAFLTCAFALGMAAIVSCNKNGGPTDLDTVMEDGFYVAGAATGATELTADYMMAVGHNEANDNSLRDGMYEKYIVLKAGEEFELLYYAAGSKTRYSAALKDFTIDPNSDEIYADNPSIVLKRGTLEIGDSAPAMKVDADGLYHIVLDLNKANDLTEAQILIAPVEFGVRGGMNSWGFTAMKTPAIDTKTMTFTVADQKMTGTLEFKFAYGGAWKITLDSAGKVKANTNLGEGAAVGTGNIKVEKPGIYEISLTYKLAGGAIENSFEYDVKLVEEVTIDLPTTMYMIGEEWGNWTWTDAGVVSMIPVASDGGLGQFWTVRYFQAGKGFKFCSVKEWNGDFTGLDTNDGYTVQDNNCFVAKDGVYMVHIDLQAKKLHVEPARIYGIGNCFGGWDAKMAGALFTEQNGKIVGTTTAAGELRMYVESEISTTDWWTREFVVLNEQIAYRGAGNDQERVNVEAGKTVTLDFNTGRGSIN